MRRNLLTIVGVATALAAVDLAFSLTGTSSPTAAATGNDEAGPRSMVAAQEPILASDRDGKVLAIAAAKGRVLSTSPSGVLSPDGELIYAHRERKIRVTKRATGRVIARVAAPPGMELEVASTSGRLLAFGPPSSGSEWRPEGRAETTIRVVGIGGEERVRSYDLEGNFAVEAFSTDDRELFLLEYMPAKAPWHYGLRRLNLSNGKIHEIARGKQNAPGEMNGTGRLAVSAPSGQELYTLYTQQGFNYTHVHPEHAKPDEVYAFVHLLNLEGAWTHCIDLPAPFGTGTASSHAMAITDDGSRLFVADPSSGGLALIDPQEQRVLRSVSTDLRAMRAGVSADVSVNGDLYLAGKDTVLVFDGDSLRLKNDFRPAPRTSGIATSADGSSLYLGRPDGLLEVDAETGARLRGITIPGARRLSVLPG